MKALFAALVLVVAAGVAHADSAPLATANAKIVKAVTNGMFPVATYKLTAIIPCWAKDAKIVKSGSPMAMTMAVQFSYDPTPGFRCQALFQQEFTTGVYSEMPPNVKLIGAAPGVEIEHEAIQ